MNIVVLAGGLSTERDVSLLSGSMIANTLIANGHKVLLMDLYKGLKEVSSFDEAYKKYSQKEYTYSIPNVAPDLKKLKVENGNRQEWIGENVVDICETADVAFLALHGAMGENGQVQSVLEAYGIKYTGSDHFGSALAMNKQVAKELLSFNGVSTPPWRIYDKNNSDDFVPTFPCVVKTPNGGSSIGVYMVENKDEFDKAIVNALQYEDNIFVEEMIKGREFTVSILDGNVLEVIEIIPKAGFFDYENKYQDGMTDEICPANIPNELKNALQDEALKAHKILRLGSYSRIDFLADINGIYCLEANTLPGMTPASLLPKAAKASGISYAELCEKLVNLALDK